MVVVNCRENDSSWTARFSKWSITHLNAPIDFVCLFRRCIFGQDLQHYRLAKTVSSLCLRSQLDLQMTAIYQRQIPVSPDFTYHFIAAEVCYDRSCCSRLKQKTLDSCDFSISNFQHEKGTVTVNYIYIYKYIFTSITKMYISFFFSFVTRKIVY